MPSPETFLDFYKLLRRIEPTDDRLDVIWNGPFWVEKEDVWRPTSLLLYRGVLRAHILLSHGSALMEGDIQTGEVKCPRIDMPGWPSGEDYWPAAFPQVHADLRAAVEDPEAYNRRVEAQMPRASRTGKIERHLTWGRDVKRTAPEKIAAIRKASESAGKRPPLTALSTAEYLRIAGIAYDAAYPEDRALAPADKHRRHADSRHGGMLDLVPGDAEAFAAWFDSTRWRGAHPFEIVYGSPHGIVLWPKLEHGEWRLQLTVSDDFYEKDALEMIVALDQAGIPVDFGQTERILKKLEGTDLVEVGPYRDQMLLAELRKARRDSVDSIRWDPLPEIKLVTAEGLARIVWVEENETMAGFGE